MKRKSKWAVNLSRYLVVSAIAASLLSIAASASAQAPPQYWVRFLTADLLNNAWRQPGLEDLIQDSGHAVLTPSGTNTWSGATDASSAANSHGFAYGGDCQAAQYVTQSAAYPHLFVTDRSNLHAYSIDAFAAQDTASGYADYRLLTLFDCEEYSYVQFSKQHYGYVESWGVRPSTTAYSRKEIYLNDVPVFDTGSQMGVPDTFYYSFFDNRYLVLPGQHRVDSRYSLLAYGGHDIGIGQGLNWHTHETFNNIYNAPTPLPSQWWVYPVPSDTVHPSTYQVVNGTQTSGSLASLNTSDNNYLQIRPYRIGPGMKVFPKVDFVAELPNLPDLALRVYIEAKSSQSNLIQSISLFNWQTDNWESQDKRASTGNDSYSLVRTEDISKYVHPGTRYVQGRVQWNPVLSGEIRRSWTCSIDEIRVMAFRQ